MSALVCFLRSRPSLLVPDLIADQKGLPREKVKSWKPYAGGAPCNVATAAARLGLDVTFMTALGDDEAGEKLLAVCQGAIGGGATALGRHLGSKQN